MPVNEFEKQVQQKLDELQLRPSAEVWEEVERRIRKEKKRRTIILWFFVLAVLLLGGTGWLFISGNKKELLASHSEKKLTATDKKINETNDTVTTENDVMIKMSVDSINVKEKKQTQPGKISVAEKKNNVSEVNAENLLPERKHFKKENKNIVIGKDIADHSNKTKESVERAEATNNEEPLKIKEEIVVADEDAVKKDAIINSIKTDSAASVISTDKKINNTDNTSQEVAIRKDDSLIVKTEDKIAKTDTSKKKKSKWEIGVNAMAGISEKVNGLSVDAQKSSVTNLNSNPAFPASRFVTAPVLDPSEATGGFLWKAGFDAKKPLTQKASFSFGINLSSYSTKQATGEFVNASGNFISGQSSGVNGFYISGTTGESYTNHYYFLELPVSFHWQLNKGNKLPIIWQNGFSTNFYLGGNALVYNSATHVFYKDNKSFNKMQFSFQSGLYAKLFYKKNKPLTVGVLFNYDISKLQKQNIIGGNHLSSFGIQIGWLLKK